MALWHYEDCHSNTRELTAAEFWKSLITSVYIKKVDFSWWHLSQTWRVVPFQPLMGWDGIEPETTKDMEQLMERNRKAGNGGLRKCLFSILKKRFTQIECSEKVLSVLQNWRETCLQQWSVFHFVFRCDLGCNHHIFLLLIMYLICLCRVFWCLILGA